MPMGCCLVHASMTATQRQSLMHRRGQDLPGGLTKSRGKAHDLGLIDSPRRRLVSRVSVHLELPGIVFNQCRPLSKLPSETMPVGYCLAGSFSWQCWLCRRSEFLPPPSKAYLKWATSPAIVGSRGLQCIATVCMAAVNHKHVSLYK